MSANALHRLKQFYGTQDNDAALKQVAARYAVSVTDAALATITHAGDPVGLQYLPQGSELITTPIERIDPIGDRAHEVMPGLIHRYPDRVLLTPTYTCAVYCRFCFRREVVGPGKKGLTAEELDNAIHYIENNSQIWEVILSGGDPLILSPRRLRDLLQRLDAIPHVQVIRLHSRVPVAAPDKITPELTAALQTKKALYLAIHINHAQEITPAVEAAFTNLRRADCVLLSQSVLLRGVNDSVEALETLFRRLVACRVKPYYLHHPDLAPGTGHFRLSIKTGQALLRALRGRLSGLAHPTYMLDIPGGFGKIPLDPTYVREMPDGDTVVTDPHGRDHAYPPRENS